DVARELVARRVYDERSAALFGDFLIEDVFADVFAGRSRHQEFFGELLCQVITGAGRAALRIGEKCIRIVGAATPRAPRLLAKRHHRLPPLRATMNKVKPVRARGNRSQPSKSPSPLHEGGGARRRS